MEKNKYLELINKSIKSPEEAPAIMKELISIVEKDCDEYESIKKHVEDSNNKIRSLQDTNMKLFLSQTNQKEEEQEEKEMTPDEVVDDFIKTITGGN